MTEPSLAEKLRTLGFSPPKGPTSTCTCAGRYYELGDHLLTCPDHPLRREDQADG
jgi:hypothetical protein